MSGAAFTYVRATDVDDALRRGAAARTTFVAGGTDLLQLWKTGRVTPHEVIDISRLPLDGIEMVDGELSIGATARLSDVARHHLTVEHHPLIGEAIMASASGQLRNMATVGGNLLQRTRCPYFRTDGMACNKHEPGTGCGAAHGENRHAALFGASSACVATHPSDLAVALVALDADVEIVGPSGVRRAAVADLYRLPGETPHIDTVLADGELIGRVVVPSPLHPGRCATYLKVRDRASFEFAVVSVAAVLTMDRGVIAAVRLAAGGVAPMPWRLPAAEARLIGQPAEAGVFAEAAAAATPGARPLAHNAFKVELLRRSVMRALSTTASLAVPGGVS